MKKISGVYKIENTITGDCYVGSSKDVKLRWKQHKRPSLWKRYPNNLMYLDMQKYGTDKFDFQILVNVEPDQLKEKEQEFIEMLNPTYNDINARGLDVERRKEWLQSEKGKESCRKTKKKYQQSSKGRESQKKYQQSNKGRESQKKRDKKYKNRLCSYKGEILTLNALYVRFRKAGIENPAIEAKKYLKEV